MTAMVSVKFPRPEARLQRGFRLGLLLLLGLLAACAQTTRNTALDDTLRSYGSYVRWGEFEQALGFVDPKRLEVAPVSSVDMERYKQIKVAGYRESAWVSEGDGLVSQIVEIEFINVHTQAISSVIDRQEWRYDPDAKRWWLVTGLPDITAGRR
jgi:hypothetical protein